MGKLILRGFLDSIPGISIINPKGGKNLGKEIYKISIISICILGFVAFGTAYAQQKKVGGGDIHYEAKGGQAAVLFSHESHVNQYKLKCNECHPKLFKTKKGEGKMAQCAACHDGKKAFSTVEKADCAKCHKS
jgi:c(7)-type cytochrome triheme protein